jgi:anti-sigma regulatory factor (Ser/Thr protein kinase)
MTPVHLPPRDSPVPAYAWNDRAVRLDRMWHKAPHVPSTPSSPAAGAASAASAVGVAPAPAVTLRARVSRGARIGAPRTAAYGFPLRSNTPRRARRHTVEFTRRWGLHDVTDSAELLVSELMTNAFEASRSCAGHRRHNPALAAAPLQLRLAVEHGRLRIEVRDDDPRPPVPDDPQPLEERGRGLLLVETYSHRWGYHRLPGGGKAVWCVVAPPSDDPTR